MKIHTQTLSSGGEKRQFRFRLAEYYALTKPRVVVLIVFTAVVGMFLSTPGAIPLNILLFATVGIALAAAAAATINHVLDRR